jgi:hypothetical protein
MEETQINVDQKALIDNHMKNVYKKIMQKQRTKRGSISNNEG